MSSSLRYIPTTLIHKSDDFWVACQKPFRLLYKFATRTFKVNKDEIGSH